MWMNEMVTGNWNLLNSITLLLRRVKETLRINQIEMYNREG
jgi:hypothetical protein